MGRGSIQKISKIKWIVFLILCFVLTSCCCPWDPRCKFNIRIDNKELGNNPWDPRPDPGKEKEKEKKNVIH